ncbi:MAG: hypothetical protein AAGB29_10550 [Planctomycetota bacterium]
MVDRKASAARYSELIRIVYRGREADGNSLPVEDIIDSLAGWDDFIEVTSNIYLQGRLTLKRPDDPSRRAQVRLREVRPGSLEVVLEFVFQAAAAGIVGHLAVKAGESLMGRLARFRREAFKTHVKSKDDDATVEEMAAALRRLADEVPYRDSDRDPVAVVEKIDRSLRRATEPLDELATTITVISESDDEVLPITARERRLILEDFAVVGMIEDEGEWFRTKVNIYDLNRRSGNAGFTFVDPQDDDQRGSFRTYLTDPVLRKRRDIYSGSLHYREPIEVYARKRYHDVDANAFRWELRSARPRNDQSGLF